MLRVKRVTIILTLGVLAKRSRVHICTRHLKSKGAIILGSGQGKKFEKERNRYDKSNARMPGCSSPDVNDFIVHLVCHPRSIGMDSCRYLFDLIYCV